MSTTFSSFRRLTPSTILRSTVPLLLLLLVAPIAQPQIAAAGTPPAQLTARSHDLAPLGKEFSVSLEIAANTLDRAGSLLRITDTSGKPAITLEVAAAGAAPGNLLQFEVFTDFSPKPLTLGVPINLIHADTAHRLILRDLGFRMDFLVDGVLADQEWPIGSVAAAGAHVAEQGTSLGDLRITPGVLTDAAIEHENGGAPAIARRDASFFGAESKYLQYWHPRGYNTSAGDPMPFFHEGVLHIFFLLDRRHHRSKWTLGAHQWGHLSTTDLVHWKSYPPALTIEREEEASICTGSVFFHGGKFYAFYATRVGDRSEHLGMAVSGDGVSFHKLLPSPFEDPKPPYKYGPNRDPFVFGEDGDFHMIATASLAHPPTPEQAGALEHLTSPDLKTWTVTAAPFLVPGYAADPECSDLFLWHGWWYLIFSENGVAHYRMSRSRSGPWTKPPVDVFDGEEARVMKTAAFNGDRRVGVAFTPDGDWYGGRLVYRELLQAADGTLSSAIPPEMIPSGAAIPFTPKSAPGVDVSPAKIVLAPSRGNADLLLPVSGNFVLTATLVPGAEVKSMGLQFAEGTGADAASPTLAIEPGRGRIAWLNSRSAVSTSTAIEGLEGLSQPTKIQLIAEGSMMDLAINGRHTLIHRLPLTAATRISLFTEGGDLTVEQIALRAIQDPQ